MIAFDFETTLIQPGFQAPAPVCLALSGGVLIGSESGWDHMRRPLWRMLQQPRIVGFNTPFDLGIILEWFPEFIDAAFDALDQGRVHCAQQAERLGEIATGKPSHFHSLSTLSAQYGLGGLDKANSPRLEYARLLGRPLSEYTEAEREYPKKDADTTQRVYERVRARYGSRVNDDAIAAETRHATWRHLCAAWGLRTDPTNIEALRTAAHEAVARLRDGAIADGFLRADGSKHMAVIKAAVWEAYGGRPPLTDSGVKAQKSNQPITEKFAATNKSALEDSGDPALMSFAEYGEWSAVINKDLKLFDFGVDHPIHTRYGTAATTRSTSSGPNVQNFRRKVGVRECIVPRPGYCFGEADVGGLELGTLAQVIAWNLGDRHMSDMISTGVDLHSLAASNLLGCTYEEAIKRKKAEDRQVIDQRQFCKIANFGYPGFMSAKTLIPYARQQAQGPNDPLAHMTLATAELLKNNWARTLPSGPRYLRWVKSKLNRDTGLYDFVIPGSENILRAGATLPSCANGHFQGLGARSMMRIGWHLTREAWTDRRSPLWRQKMNLFVHDSFMYEIKIGEQHEVMARVQAVMRERLAEYLPDVKLDAEPIAMSVMSKNAKHRVDAEGKLAIWEP